MDAKVDGVKRPPPREWPDDSPSEMVSRVRDLYVVNADNFPVARMCARFLETWIKSPVMGVTLLVDSAREA